MKKYICMIPALAICMAAGAQNVEDALRLSSNDYYGTARSMGMANAMTAVGSDHGSIVFNPAGSAVAPYSQVTISPGFNMSFVNSSLDGGTYGKTSARKAILPNIGATCYINTGRQWGLKGVSFGFICNMSQNYLYSMETGGRTASSYAGSIADYATHNKFHVTEGIDYGNTDDWMSLLAYDAYMIDPIDDAQSAWIGATENIHTYTAGGHKRYEIESNPVDARYIKDMKGNKMDYVFNLAFNISDIVFIGANLGIQSMTYSYDTRLEENAVQGVSYQTRFRNLSYSYSYEAAARACYGKVGVLVTPVAGLRLGAAFTTPTLMNVQESWINQMSTTFYKDDSHDNYNENKAKTPVADNRYAFTSPFSFNLGVAYTLGNFAMLSLDYEMANYAQARYSTWQYQDNDFYNLNREIRGQLSESELANYMFLGPRHLLRCGVEIKPMDVFAIRAGYSLATSGKKLFNEGRVSNIDENTHCASFGLGYDSRGSFFVDLACILKFCPKEQYLLYSSYTAGPEPPYYNCSQMLASMVCTVGWRF